MDRVFSIDVSRSTVGPVLTVYLGESPAFRIQGAGLSDVIYLHIMAERGAAASLESILAPGVPVDLAGLTAGDYHYEIWKAASNLPTLLSSGRLSLTDATAPVLGPIAEPVAAGALADLNLTEGVAISPVFTATDFTGSGLTFALAPGSAALPSGLSLSSSGVLTGTPATPGGPASIVIRATNVSGFADSAFSIDVAAAPIPAPVAAGGLADLNLTEGVAISALDLSTDFTGSGLTFALAPAVTLPFGLSLSSAGILTGTPDTVGGPASIVIRATNVSGFADSAFSIDVAAAPIPAPVAAGGLADLNLTEGVAISALDLSADFTGSGLTFALAPGSAAVPSGLSLSSSGLLTGTPDTVGGPDTIVVRATNAGGFADSAFSIDVAAVPFVIDAVVVLGASIVEQSFGRNLNTPNTDATALLDSAGVAGVPVYGYGFSGEQIADATAEIDTIFATHPNALVVLHTGGNNVTETRPYSTATAGELSAIGADYDALIAKALEYPNRVYIGSLTFRSYGTPTSAAALFQDPALGSKPYNENILLPKLAASMPNTLQGGRPVFDLYRFVLSDFENILENDGIHPDTIGEATMRDFITARAADVILGNPVSVLSERVYSIPAPVAADGLADLNLTEGVAISALDLSADFTGSGITYALAPTSNALPSGLSLSSSGLLTGTPDTVGGPVAIVIRGTNAGGFDDSAFLIEVVSATAAPTAAGGLADLNLTEGVAISALDLSTDFTGSGLIFALAPGSAAIPSGLSLSSSGVLTGTPDTVGGPASIVIRATNVSGFADSAFSIDVAAAGAPGINVFVDYGGTPPANVNLMFEEDGAAVGETGIPTIALVNLDGTPSGASLRSDYSDPGTGDFFGYGINPQGRSVGVSFNGTTIRSDPFTSDTLYAYRDKSVTHVLTGLTPGGAYSVDLIASRAASGSRITQFDFSNGETAQIETTANPVEPVVTVNTVADGSGQISITQSALTGDWSYIGGLRIYTT